MRQLCTTLFAAVLLAGCTTGEGGGEDVSGAVTAVDSTGDTVRVTVTGDPPAERVRHLVEELRIAPGADDTSMFAEVYEAVVDRAGRVWVFDAASNQIFLFGADGTLIRRVGRQGAGPGEFNANNGMVALADSGLAIWDARNARVSFFSAAGDFVRSFSTPAQFSTFNGLLYDEADVLYLRRPVTPPREGEILGRMGLVRLDSTGVFVDTLLPPDLRVPQDVYIAVSKDGGGRSSTHSLYAPQFLWAWHPAGYFIVANSGSYSIVASRANRAVMITREVTPVVLSEEERKDEEERILWSMRNTDPSWRWSGPGIPQAKAPLTQLFVARDGRIWARVATPSERIPEDELTPRRDKGPPVSRFRSTPSWEVFEPSGLFLGRITFPPRTSLVQADGNRVWTIARDDNDLPAIVRWRIEPSVAAIVR